LYAPWRTTTPAHDRGAWQAGIRFFDTAPLYGHGLAEIAPGRGARRIARAKLRARDQGRPAAAPVKARSSEDGTTRARRGRARIRLFLRRRDALGRREPARLKLDRIDILHIHDPTITTMPRSAARIGRSHDCVEEGTIGAIGAG
jgi:D-threo-aldose 1-dehydrogenase